jgi:adenosylcobinamide-GDP ribazoletransferase
VADYSPEELSASAPWFPLIGAIIGGMVAVVFLLCARWNVAIAAALSLLAWVCVTGALHLDGLADLADALAAAHRDPQRFFTVLADPHVGAFGVVSIVLALMVKGSAMTQLSSATLGALPLVPAWARLGALAWSYWLKPLKPGHGERFAWNLHSGWIVFWVLLLLSASAALAPILCIAPLVIAAWGTWLHFRLGGATGDCLGAGIEVTETVLLVALCGFTRV